MSKQNKNLVFGGLLVLLGVTFLASELSLLTFNPFTFFFTNHVWVIALGIFIIFKPKSDVIFGTLFVVLGTLFFASDIGLIQPVNWGNAWPLFLIALGLKVWLRPSSNQNLGVKASV